MALSSRLPFSSRVPSSSLHQRLWNLPTMVFDSKTSSSKILHPSKLPFTNHFTPPNLFNNCMNHQSWKSKVTTDEAVAQPEDKSQTVKKKLNMIDVAVRFVRPYIFLAAILSFMSTTTRIWLENPHLVSSSHWSLPSRALAVLSCLLGIHGYVGPLNDISDIEIDRINKPNLPLVTGEIPLRQAWTFVISSAMYSITSAFFLDSKALFPLILLLLSLGTIYSVRPFCTKRSTFGAILTCASMRGYAFTLLHWAAARAIFRLPFKLSPSVVFLTIFSTLLGLCVGAMKDLPDVEGDRKSNIRTLATIIGAKNVAYLAFGLLFVTYTGSAATAVLLSESFRPNVMVPTHLLAGCFVAFQGWKLDKANYSKEASKIFYKTFLVSH